MPSKPKSGRKLPVFGSSAGAAGAVEAAGVGGGAFTATRIGASAAGAGGGGGIEPVSFLWCSISVVGLRAMAQECGPATTPEPFTMREGEPSLRIEQSLGKVCSQDAL